MTRLPRPGSHHTSSSGRSDSGRDVLASSRSEGYSLDGLKSVAKEMMAEYHKEANTQASRLGIQGGGRDGSLDAFRHAYTSARISRDYGTSASDVAGLLNEVRGSLNDCDYPGAQMDIWNNFVGSHAIGALAGLWGLDDNETADLTKSVHDMGLLVVLGHNSDGSTQFVLSSSNQSSSATTAQSQATAPERIDRPGCGDLRIDRSKERVLDPDVRFDRWDGGKEPSSMLA